MIKDIAGANLFYFGYVKMEDNPTGFFNFENSASGEMKDTFNAFKRSNEKMMEFVTDKNGNARRASIRINDGKEENFRLKNGLAAFDTSLLDLHKDVKILN